ncbi:MAG TPA: MoxR family ATPase, partial [Nakamurella sp.]
MTQRVDLERSDSPGTGDAVPGGNGGVDLAMVKQVGGQIADAISRVVLGKPEVIRLAIIAVLAEGHLLIEDVPGTGKTVLAKSLARTVDSTVSRVQFTPDLMPSD